MSWSRMTLLAIDSTHCHAAHERWIDTHASEQRARIDYLWGQMHARAAEISGSSEPASEEYQAALTRAKSEAKARGEDPGEWIANQCGGCAMYVNLEGNLGMDWGACTNPASEHDGTILFEHDGCSQFVPDEAPVTPEYLEYLGHEVSNVRRRLAEARQEARQAARAATRLAGKPGRGRGGDGGG